MKRLFLFGCLMLMAINAMAYQQMLVEGRIWTFSVFGDATGIDSIDNKYSSYYCKIDGDSVIDGEVYKKVYKSYYNKTDWIFDCLMMEDVEEGKVWKYDYSYISKQYYKDLIFDFSLNVGDKFKNGSTICENIKYVEDRNGNVLKRIDFGMYCWIEGYGYEYNVLIGASYYLSSVEDEKGLLIDCSKDLESYDSMVVEGYSWNVVSSYLQMFPDTKKYSTQKQLIEGDSIVDGIVYKKLWWFSDANSDEKSLVVLLREDIEEQKVFAYDKGVEVLLYDLGVEVGDTIKVLGDLSDLVYDFHSTIIKENISLVVDNIDFIEDPIYGRLKVVTYYNADPNFNEFKCTVYERYGMTTGWLYNICMAYVGGGSQRVICAFDENDELVLKREYTIAGYGEVKDCYINEEIGTNVETPQKEENIYYNSQEKRLYVDVENAEMIMVYDAVGKNIMTKEVDLETKSISLNLNSGIYIVMTKSGNRYAKIVVK